MTEAVPAVLITGATGFLGSRLARALLDAGYRVKAVRRGSSSLARIADITERIDWLVADAVLAESLPQFLDGVDCVIHTAASYGRKGETVSDVALTNTLFGLRILEGAIAAGVGLFINTDTSLARDSKPYALSKAHLADWGRMLSRGSRISFLNIRLEHMYGPGDDDIKFTSHVINACVANKESLGLTAGLQERDFIYIDDVVSAYLLLVREGFKHVSGYRDIAVGSGQTVTIRHLVETIKALAGSTTELKFGAVATDPAEVMFSCADIGEMTRMGWQPAVALDSGLRRTVSAARLQAQRAGTQ